MRKATHPKAVLPIIADGKTLSDEVVLGINAYLGTYFVIALASTAVVTLSGVDVITGFSSVATTLSNVGPGFGDIGPTKNFAFYNDFLNYILVLSCYLEGLNSLLFSHYSPRAEEERKLLNYNENFNYRFRKSWLYNCKYS